MTTAQQLTFDRFARLAEEMDVSWVLRRRAGSGYTIEVAQRGYVDEAGDEIVYPTLMDALLAGMQILEAETEDV